MNVQIRFIGTDSQTWKSHPYSKYYAPYNFSAVFECINPEINRDTFGIFYDYKSTKEINGKEWYLTHRLHGNSHGWEMFARTTGEFWDHYSNIGVHVGHPIDEKQQFISNQSKQFPIWANQWRDAMNSVISVYITNV